MHPDSSFREKTTENRCSGHVTKSNWTFWLACGDLLLRVRDRLGTRINIMHTYRYVYIYMHTYISYYVHYIRCHFYSIISYLYMMYIRKLEIIANLNHSAGLVSHRSHGFAPVFGESKASPQGHPPSGNSQPAGSEGTTVI